MAPSSDTLESTSSIYNDVALALAQAHKGEFQVEILLESHSLPPGVSVVIEENTIGITKKTLVKAFLEARKVFFGSARGQEKFQASSVMLLLHPEHLTAANARKRFVLSLPHGDQRTLMLQEDMNFLKCLFRSPLNRHTKSPTLWSHRRWLVEQLYVPVLSLQPRLLEHEMRIVALAAAETHPRNYYAWEYMRYVVGRHPALLFSFEEYGRPATASGPPGISRIFEFFCRWCFKHPSDTSGWSFLFWLLTLPPALLSMPMAAIPMWQASCVEEILRKTHSLALRNEALWSFLRAVVNLPDYPAPLRSQFSQEALAAFPGPRDETSKSMRDITSWLNNGNPE